MNEEMKSWIEKTIEEEDHDSEKYAEMASKCDKHTGAIIRTIAMDEAFHAKMLKALLEAEIQSM